MAYRESITNSPVDRRKCQTSGVIRHLPTTRSPQLSRLNKSLLRNGRKWRHIEIVPFVFGQWASQRADIRRKRGEHRDFHKNHLLFAGQGELASQSTAICFISAFYFLIFDNLLLTPPFLTSLFLSDRLISFFRFTELNITIECPLFGWLRKLGSPEAPPHASFFIPSSHHKKAVDK